ncbi:MAG: hypothetical protein D6743_02575 [Calditrichaeota bacterium]|nr:MAG: hypothetical protein D6743_02575 [Calditrichota bacterium]
MHEQQKRLDFEGRVKIVSGQSTVRAQRIEYYWEDRQSYCYGQVQIRNGPDSLYAEYLAYDFTSGLARARQEVYLYHAQNLAHVWGQRALYDPQQRFSQVVGRAHLLKPDTSSGDTLNIFAHTLQFYNDSSQRRALALDSVRIEQGRLKAVCDTAEYFVDQDRALLHPDPVAWYDHTVNCAAG